MRRLVPILALGLLAACGRDFSLPPAPATASGPRFLGPLAGFYVLDAPIPAFPRSPGSYDVETPLGTVMVLQDVTAPDGGADPVAASLVDVETPPLTVPVQSVRATAPLMGSYQGRVFTASRSLAGGKAGVTGTPIAGGGGLDLAYATCPGETLDPVVIHARQVCDYEPQLSGVFAGHAGTCADPASGDVAYLGLGIRDVGPGQSALALGLAYPDTGRLFAGRYDRFTGCGSGLVFDAVNKTTGLASFTLVDDGQNLTLDLRQGPLDQVPPADACQQASRTCTSRFEGTRKRGSAPDHCQPPTPTGLTLAWSESGSGTGRVLDVRLHAVGGGDIAKGTRALGRALDNRSYLQAVLLRADGKPCAACQLDPAPPADAALRFDLPPAAVPPVAYRLQVWAAAAGIPFAAAFPACVTDPPRP